MSEHEKKEPTARAEEPELSDETLEEVAGGNCTWGDACVTFGDIICDMGSTGPTF